MKKIDIATLLIAVFIIGISIYTKSYSKIQIIDSPKPVATPVEPLPELQNNIIDSDYNKALNIAKQYNRKIIVILSTKWCPYCKDLYRDIKDIPELKNYIVCLIDLDDHPEFTKKLCVKVLPTSVILDTKEKELSRKTGYKNKTYREWLLYNKDEGNTSCPQKTL